MKLNPYTKQKTQPDYTKCQTTMKKKVNEGFQRLSAEGGANIIGKLDNTNLDHVAESTATMAVNNNSATGLSVGGGTDTTPILDPNSSPDSGIKVLEDFGGIDSHSSALV